MATVAKGDLASALTAFARRGADDLLDQRGLRRAHQPIGQLLEQFVETRMRGE